MARALPAAAPASFFVPRHALLQELLRLPSRGDVLIIALLQAKACQRAASAITRLGSGDDSSFPRLK
eukprot:5278902-Alexandrium_andersonii.AAC.1